jgi:membrane protein CcdC involved in cytochrome C biogenesis
MEDPLSLGLILGGALSLVGPWLSRRTVREIEVFLPKIGVNSSAALGTLPMVLTPLLILLVAVIDDIRNSEAIDALMICAAVVMLVGWPIAFVFARKSIARARCEANQDPLN